MSPDPDALREIVDQKAEDLKRDVEELSERIVAQPKAAVEQKIETARKVYGPVTTFVRRRPVVAAIAAAALGFAAGFFL